MITDQHPLNKHMTIGLWGVPNAGKSTLVNNYLGFSLSAVTPKAQTTRNAFHCVVVKDRTELVIVDTPGLHKSGKEMNIRMTGQAQEYVESTHLILMLVDLTQRIETQFEVLSSFKRPDKIPVAVVFNKIDKVPAEKRGPLKEKTERLMKEHGLEEAPTYWISGQESWGTEGLLDDLCACAQSGPHRYPDGSVSNKNQRFFVSEYIREEAFKILEQELPYEMAVMVEEFIDIKEADSKIVARISANIIVNRASQRAIVIGAGGKKIKLIGQRARAKIESMLGGNVFLNLHVKVQPSWYKNNLILSELHLPRVENSHRVWRSE